MPSLCVNVDHVATVRQARRGAEPDLVAAALEAEAGGAAGITVHLREDRRHVQDADLPRLKAAVRTHLNLEMAATAEMVGIASSLRPRTAMLVPERRQEVTTEGGLDVAGNGAAIADAIGRLHQAGITVSVFIDPEPRQLGAAAAAGADVCELHTGAWAHAVGAAPGTPAAPAAASTLAALRGAGRLVLAAGMRLNAGHGLATWNVGPIASLPGLQELHIGHSIVSRALFVGLRRAVEEMARAIAAAIAAGGAGSRATAP